MFTLRFKVLAVLFLTNMLCVSSYGFKTFSTSDSFRERELTSMEKEIKKFGDLRNKMVFLRGPLGSQNEANKGNGHNHAENDEPRKLKEFFDGIIAFYKERGTLRKKFIYPWRENKRKAEKLDRDGQLYFRRGTRAGCQVHHIRRIGFPITTCITPKWQRKARIRKIVDAEDDSRTPQESRMKQIISRWAPGSMLYMIGGTY